MASSDAPWTINLEEFDLGRVALLKAKTSVAVVIPAKNEADTIGAVLEAVRHHEDFVDELVVVDDHSNDDTAKMCIRDRGWSCPGSPRRVSRRPCDRSASRRSGDVATCGRGDRTGCSRNHRGGALDIRATGVGV